MRRKVLNSPRLLELQKNRHRIFLNKILLSLFTITLIFACLAYASRIPSFNIDKIEIKGNKVVDTEAIKVDIEKEITGNYLWFFPKTNVLFYPKNNIQKGLHEKFKGIKDINLSVKDGKILEVSITERTALYIWCGDTPPEINISDKPKCSFLDDSGYIFDEAPYFSGEVYFKFYGSLSQVDFEKLISFKKTLETMGLKPVALYIDRGGDIKIFLSAKNSSSNGPEIIFKADSDSSIIAKNLETALGTEPLLSNFKNKYSSLEYIDLRFGNKVYYKFK